MARVYAPDLKKYMDKSVVIQMNGARKIQGILRGFDPFMNIVLDQTYDQTNPREPREVGMVVIRGNSVVMLEIAPHGSRMY